MWFLQYGLTFMDVLMRILATFIIVFLILPLHELAHAWVAYKLGDKTAKALGRLSFNPIAHFDPIGAVCILLFNFGWAKPVPVDPRYFKNPRRDMALVALAGPLSNFLAAIVGGFLFHISTIVAVSNNTWAHLFLSYYIIMNITLAVFNLLPLHPLDGSKILEAFIPQKFIMKYYQNYRMITLILFLLLFFGFFSGPLAFFAEILYNFVIKIAALPFSIFM